jgi:hypothetical protein
MVLLQTLFLLQCVHKVPSGFWKIVTHKQIELATCGLRQIIVKLWKRHGTQRTSSWSQNWKWSSEYAVCMAAPIKACVIQEILNKIHVYHKIMTILEALQHLFKGSGNHRFILNAVLMAPYCTQKWRFEKVTIKTNTWTIKQFNIIVGHADIKSILCD